MGTALLIGRVALALVFAVAAVAKLADRDRTAQTLDEFGVPERLLGAAAMALPLAELAIAAALIPAPTAAAAAIGALALLVLFSLGVAAALRRGERPDCNCFGQVGSKPVGRSTFVRNGLLATLAAAVALGGGGSSFAEAFDGVTGTEGLVGAGIVAVVAAIALQAWFSWQLFRQNGRLVARVSVLERALAGDAAPVQHSALEIGDPVPSFALPDLEGARRSLDDLLAPGAPFALLFSDPGCAACGPLLGRLAEVGDEQEAPIEIVVISRGDAAEERTRMNGHLPATVLLQEAHEVADLCGVPAVPTAFVVDAAGRLASEAVAGQEGIEELISSWRRPAPELAVVSGGGGR